MRRAIVSILKLLVLLLVAVPSVGAFRAKRTLPGISTFQPHDDEIDVAAVFEGGDLHSQAGAFDGGEVLVWFGGLRLDLTHARLDPAGASLQLRCLWGGLDVVVPHDWGVEVVRSRALAGGLGNAVEPQRHPGPTLQIDALAVFGGIAIRHPDGDEHLDGAGAPT